MNRAGPASALQGYEWISSAHPSGLPPGIEASGLNQATAAASYRPEKHMSTVFPFFCSHPTGEGATHPQARPATVSRLRPAGGGR